MPAEPIYPKHFFETSSAVPRRMCFVLMPFRTELSPVYAAVQRACANAGYQCLRADEIDQPGAILVQIMGQIAEAGAVVADVTGGNPNVFYELGIAHVRKENVILLAQDVGQVPFDLRHWRLIDYENSQYGRRRLRERLERMIRLLPNESPTIRRDEPDMSTLLQELLRQRMLEDPRSSAFGANELGNRLYTRHEQCEHGAEKPRCVIYCGSPSTVRGDVLHTSTAEFRRWFDPNKRRYEPNVGSFFVPYKSTRLRLDGILATESVGDQPQLRSYLLVMKNGYVERGRELAMCYRGQAVFRLTPILSELWQFIGFLRDLYERDGYTGPFNVILNMVNTRYSELSDLGVGWQEPFELGRLPGEQFACELPNLQLRIDNLSLATPTDEVDEKVRGLAMLIDNAYGFWESRAFNSARSENPGALNPRYV